MSVVIIESVVNLEGWTVVSASKTGIVLMSPDTVSMGTGKRVIVGAKTVNYGEDAELTYEQPENVIEFALREGDSHG